MQAFYIRMMVEFGRKTPVAVTNMLIFVREVRHPIGGLKDCCDKEQNSERHLLGSLISRASPVVMWFGIRNGESFHLVSRALPCELMLLTNASLELRAREKLFCVRVPFPRLS